MPLYEYRCETCGEKEEKLEGFSAPTEHDCSQCGAPLAMRRQISLTSFTLAGGGWMAQGYGSAAGGGGSKSAASPSPSPAAPASPAPASGGCAGGCACHSTKPAE